jgi:hypothetical protein
MIIIKSGKRTIYHPGKPGLQLIEPRLTLEDNAAGSLTFRIYEDNLNRESVKKLYPLITVIRDGRTIFKGRVVSERKDFYNGCAVEAEGKLAFLNDSCMEPFSFTGSPEELFRMIIENHNAQVMDWQRFRVGVVTVTDPNDYIVRSSESVLNSWETLKSRCFQSSLGGYVRIRYEPDGDYIDWLDDYTKVCSQGIAFARNMVSMSLEKDATETYTAIRPVGAEVDGARIDISSVNNGRAFLVNEELAKRYGVIFAPERESQWDDVTLPENLLKKAQEKLYGSMAAMSETYEIGAVDLNLTDPEIEALDICEYVPVESRPHGISGRYLLSRAEICIASPQNSVYHLGASERVLSDMASGGGEDREPVPRKVSALENDTGYISEEKAGEMLAEYPSTSEVERIVNVAVGDIPAGASAYESALGNGFVGTEAEWLESLKGARGLPGADGMDGAPGTAATIRIGTVTTGLPGTEASVVNAGTESEAVLNFTIPRGEKGNPGSSGGMTVDLIATLEGVKQNEEPGMAADALAVKELAVGLPFRLGVDANGNYGYYKDGADTVTPFKTGDGGGGVVLGIVPSELTGTLWMEAGEGEIEGIDEIFILSSVPAEAEGGLWSAEGERLAVRAGLESAASEEIGAAWIE